MPQNNPEAEACKQFEQYFMNLGNTILWKNPRGKFKTIHGTFMKAGLGGNGASDYIGFQKVIITEEMVGKTIAIFIAAELKRFDRPDRVRTTTDQIDFVNLINKCGGKAAIIDSMEDAKKLLEE